MMSPKKLRRFLITSLSGLIMGAGLGYLLSSALLSDRIPLSIAIAIFVWFAGCAGRQLFELRSCGRLHKDAQELLKDAGDITDNINEIGIAARLICEDMAEKDSQWKDGEHVFHYYAGRARLLLREYRKEKITAFESDGTEEVPSVFHS